MIELTLEEFILWVVCTPIVGIGLYTAFMGLRSSSRVRKAKNHVISCRGCGHLYQDRSRDKDPVCPNCGRANERGRSRRLG